jgi:hypothetical protein
MKELQRFESCAMIITNIQPFAATHAQGKVSKKSERIVSVCLKSLSKQEKKLK